MMGFALVVAPPNLPSSPRKRIAATVSGSMKITTLALLAAALSPLWAACTAAIVIVLDKVARTRPDVPIPHVAFSTGSLLTGGAIAALLLFWIGIEIERL
jgi:hypothetical protein